jgi:hypothetical protein
VCLPSPDAGGTFNPVAYSLLVCVFLRPLEDALPGQGGLEILQVIEDWGNLEKRYDSHGGLTLILPCCSNCSLSLLYIATK